MSELKICLTKSQADYLSLIANPECFNALFVGGPGCGKSYLLGLCAVLLAQHSKDANIYIYAPEHHHIRTIEVPNVLYWLDQFNLKNKGYNKQEGFIEVTSLNCGNIYFKPMDNPSTFVGYQSYAALIDELDTLSIEKAEEVYKKVFERNRQQPKDVAEQHRVIEHSTKNLVCKNQILSFTTPEGYNFCYQRWELETRTGYFQVKGRTADNPTITNQYLEGIRDKYPPHIAEAYLNGEFINMQSLSVYYNYDPVKHDSFETIRPGENLYIGCDFNVENTAAVFYVKRNGGAEWHAVYEYSGIKDAATLGSLIKKNFQDIGHTIYVYPDSSGKSRNNANTASLSAIQELTSRGFILRAPTKNFLVEDRINATNNAFSKGKLYVNQRTCPVFSRCLINQAFAKDGKPDKKTGYDHSNDAGTYPIVYELGLRTRLFKIPFNFVQKTK